MISSVAQCYNPNYCMTFAIRVLSYNYCDSKYIGCKPNNYWRVGPSEIMQGKDGGWVVEEASHAIKCWLNVTCNMLIGR